MEEIEVKDFKKIFKKFRANAMQLFEGNGLYYLLTESIKFEETKSGMVCRVKHLQRNIIGIEEVEKCFVRFYVSDGIFGGFIGELKSGERIEFFLISGRLILRDDIGLRRY